MPVQVVRSTVGRTMAAAPFTELAMWGPKVAYRPRPDGRFVIGNGYRGVGGDYDITPNSFRQLRHFLPAYRRNWRLLRLTLGREFMAQLKATSPSAAPEPPFNRRKITHNLAAFRRLFPHLGEIGLETAWAGRIDLTPDVIPIMDNPAGAVHRRRVLRPRLRPWPFRRPADGSLDRAGTAGVGPYAVPPLALHEWQRCPCSARLVDGLRGRACGPLVKVDQPNDASLSAQPYADAARAEDCCSGAHLMIVPMLARLRNAISIIGAVHAIQLISKRKAR
ncbi:hypothetical protein ACFQU7_38780 [Pseudoroseomonas wenyumeiae]